MTDLPRLARLHELAAAQGLDALVAVGPANVQYLTGCDTTLLRLYGDTPMWAVYATAERSTTLVAPSIRLPGLSAGGFDGKLMAFGAAPFWRRSVTSEEDPSVQTLAGELAAAHASPIDALAAAISRASPRGRIGVDDARLSAAQERDWAAVLPNCEFVPASQLFSVARLVKSAAEVEMLAAAAQELEAGLTEVMGSLAAGTSELAANRQVRAELARRGGHFAAGALCFGSRGAAVLPPSPNVHLQPGQIVKWDIAGHFGGYWADTARTACWQSAPEAITLLFDAVAQAHTALLAEVRPGVRACDLYALAHGVLAAAGAPAPQGHVGHGIGLDLYEPPLLAPHDTTLLQTGMVLCLENPIFALGTGALTLEDTVVVEPGGARLLTHSSRNLQVLGQPER